MNDIIKLLLAAVVSVAGAATALFAVGGGIAVVTASIGGFFNGVVTAIPPAACLSGAAFVASQTGYA